MTKSEISIFVLGPNRSWCRRCSRYGRQYNQRRLLWVCFSIVNVITHHFHSSVVSRIKNKLSTHLRWKHLLEPDFPFRISKWNLNVLNRSICFKINHSWAISTPPTSPRCAKRPYINHQIVTPQNIPFAQGILV